MRILRLLLASLLVVAAWGQLVQSKPEVIKTNSPSQDKDLYIDGGSGVYTDDDGGDDDDLTSGSGSEPEDKEVEVTAKMPHLPPYVPKETEVEITTALNRARKMPAITEPAGPDKGEPRNFVTEPPNNVDQEVSAEKHSDSLFQRTEVLAAVIAGGVIGFLFAIFLILLLVYRMRKKDEGSYDLGERKPSNTAYQKAPTKEFYA
ncbi:syndecan-2 isoform X2 [Protopterus annectens]|uniref:syndecan-2 isoform X2 n=1 Tax=Protopterus annectens TaxID=7888 RepID=UPI001CFB87F0|nr:syndecan-2 isoform X2 [Protopterus annectens]